MTNKLIFLLVALLLSWSSSFSIIIIPSEPNTVQQRYRWRNDDGNEASASWKGANNTVYTFTTDDLDKNMRLRLEFNNTGDESGTIGNTLQYSINGGSTWVTINFSSVTNHFILVSSSNVTHEEPTTAQMGTGVTGTFSSGKIISATSGGFVPVANGFKTENEYVIQATNNILEDTEYLFRIAGLNSYTNYGKLETDCLANVANVTDGEVCGSGAVNLSANGLTGNTINWYTSPTGGTSIFTGLSYTTPALSTTTTYYVEASSSMGCTSGRFPVVANVTNFNIGTTEGFVCGSGSVTLSLDPSSDIASVNWYSDPAATLLAHTGASFNTPPLSATTTYYAIASTANCASDITSVVATVRPLPELTLSPERDTVCNGQSATFIGTIHHNYTYEWDSGEMTPDISTNVHGGHTLTVTDITTTCQSSFTVFLDTAIAVSVDGFNFIPQIHTNYKTVSFYPINDIGASAYFWDFGDGHSSTEREPIHTYTDSGTYLVKLFLNNKCYNDSTALDIYVRPQNTSTEDMKWNNLISIYPNPATDIINIKVDGIEKISQVSIINIAGQILFNQEIIPSATYAIPMDQYSTGQYFIIITSESGNKAIKQVVLQ